MVRKIIRQLSFAEAHHRQGIALLVAAAVLALCWKASAGRVILGWDAYAATLLVLAWLRIFTASPAAVVRVARLEHMSRAVLLLVVLLGACASLGAVGYLLFTKSHDSHGEPLRALLAVITVGLSWMLVHTAFTLHYAFMFHRIPGSQRVQAKPQGLLFPGKGTPDYLDFAYFSFVIGMTSQVSDVQIASRAIRRWALLHGMLSFGFNTAVLALSVNVISGLF